jgi:hypothetical protein
VPEKATAAQTAEKGQPTPYVVLCRVRAMPASDLTEVFEVPGDVKAADLFGALQDGAWVPLGQATTKGEVKAIEAVVGEAKGAFKAVALRSWKGGAERVVSVRNVPLEESDLADHTPDE